MALLSSGSCSCYITYIYPKNKVEDGRRWFVVLNADKTDAMHNHHPPSEWRIPPNVLSDITRTAQRNFSVTPKEVQKGVGMNYRPMELSLAAANIDRIRSVMKKARQEVDKIDNERVNPFKIIASFPAIKKRIDENNLCQNTEMIEKMVDSYQLRGDNAYCFGRERQFAHFQSPFQAFQWANAEVLFVDIDYTGCHHFPYLLNIVCQNNVTSKYMACGRSLLNQQDAVSIGRALSVLVRNVSQLHCDYNINRVHKEILLDFDESEAKAFIENFGHSIASILRGCSVHFIRSTMRVAKAVNFSTASNGYHIFMSIAKRIPDEPSSENVQKAFDVLCGAKSFETFSCNLPPNLSTLKSSEVDTTLWKNAETWVNWWRRPSILKKLSKAYTALPEDDWDDLPGTTNPVESINRQSIPPNMKLVSLKPLIEHMYLEDRRQAILEMAVNANITISYNTKKKQRCNRPSKPPRPEKQSSSVPTGKRAVGARVSVEFYNDDMHKATTWYKGTVISYNRSKGYVISFDGCGPEENEVIRSLKKAFEKGEIKLL